MIAITGPLSAAQRGLAAAQVAKDQITANYLAQDALEYIYYVRDSNKLVGYSFLINLVNCTSSTPCIVDTTNTDTTTAIQTSGGGNDLLYLDSYGRYTHTVAANRVTTFSRRFYVTPSASNNSAVVTVMVDWKSGNLGNTETINSWIFDR